MLLVKLCQILKLKKKILLYGHCRYIYNSVVYCMGIKNKSHSISYEDLRLQNYLRSLQDKYSNAEKNNEFVENHQHLKNIVSLTQDINLLETELNELDIFISELKGKDEEMFIAAKSEKSEVEKKLNTLKLTVLQYLVPDEITDVKDVIMELSAGVGGQEAMLFNKDMFNMYCNFVQWKGWSFEVLKYDDTGIGGLRSGHLSISGKNVFKYLKYECGVHRVQRIPKTEKSGRIHTSTMTVAILPQPSDIDITIDSKDIEIEFKRSGGAGGQHVNTTDSCVRILHKPSGLIVESQMERNQHKNRELALKSLRAQLYERELESRNKDRSLSRKLQVGTAARSEKVRTYNFVQDRITDHRAQTNIYGIESFFDGNEFLSKMIDSLQDWNSTRILMEILQKYNS